MASGRAHWRDEAAFTKGLEGFSATEKRPVYPEPGEGRGRWCGLKLGDTGRAKAQGVIGLSQALNSALSSLGSVFFIPLKRVTHVTALQREF